MKVQVTKSTELSWHDMDYNLTEGEKKKEDGKTILKENKCHISR